MVVIYNFLSFFAIFWEFSIVCWVGKHRNDFFFFFRSFSASPNQFWLEMKIFEFFCYFFGIFNSGSGWNPLERFFLFSLFLGLSQPNFALNEAMMVFSNFLNFFDIFLEFSIPGRVETHRNDYFHFQSFSAFRILFLHEKKLWWCFLIFWIFLLFFWNFLLRVE